MPTNCTAVHGSSSWFHKKKIADDNDIIKMNHYHFPVTVKKLVFQTQHFVSSYCCLCGLFVHWFGYFMLFRVYLLTAMIIIIVMLTLSCSISLVLYPVANYQPSYYSKYCLAYSAYHLSQIRLVFFYLWLSFIIVICLHSTGLSLPIHNTSIIIRTILCSCNYY